MFRSLFDIVERQRDLREEDRIALLEQWKSTGAKPEITSWWSKTIFLDPETGDDNNEGSPDFPVKTLEKAIQLIPVGGAGLIQVRKGKVVEVNKEIEVLHKLVNIVSADSINADFPDYENNQNAPVIVFNDGGILVNVGSQITFGHYYYGIVIIDQKTSSEPIVKETSIIHWGGEKLLGHVGFAHSRIILSKGLFQITDIRFRKTVINSPNYQFLDASDTLILMLNEAIPKNPDDSTSNWNWKDVIKNIVKDSNGVPMNVIANAVI